MVLELVLVVDFFCPAQVASMFEQTPGCVNHPMTTIFVFLTRVAGFTRSYWKSAGVFLSLREVESMAAGQPLLLFSFGFGFQKKASMWRMINTREILSC